MISGLTSIFRETVPPGVLGTAATLNPPPAPVTVTDLTEAAIPVAWKDGKANVLAIANALSGQLGKPLPWVIVQSAIYSGINTRWIELAPNSQPWPCEFANAQHVVVQAATSSISDDHTGQYGQKRLGTITAEATLEANGVQDLADKIPGISMAAVGHQLRFNIQIELGGENPPDHLVVEAINSLLAEVSEDLKLR